MRVLTWLVVCMTTALGATAENTGQQVIQLVAQIQRADYEGDRRALAQKYSELAPYMNDKAIASRVAYWRGFAL